MHDDMQAMRVLQLDKCISDFQFPCRWVPDMGYGYGYPQFIYYSPLPYYVMEVFHLSGLQFIDSVKAGIVLGFVLSGIFMFLLGRSLWGNLGGLISSVFYIYAPYHASDIYTRGAMGEFWALVFLPLIFWAVLEYVRQEKIKYLIFLVLSIGCLLITHNITSVAFIPISALWAIYLIFYYKKTYLWKGLLLSSVWGVGIAGFFLLPVIFEKKFAHTETMIIGYFNYLAHFVSIKQLFTSSHWGFGSSELGQYDDLSFSIGIFHWLFALATLIVSFILRKKEKIFPLILFLFGIGIFGSFMTHQRSSFIWNSLPILAYFQFPWRFLTIIVFSTSIIAGYLIFLIKSVSLKIFISITLVLLVLLFNVSFFRPREWYNISDKDKFSGQSWEKQLTISIFDYLPIYAKFPPDKEAPREPVVSDGKAEFLYYNKGSNWQEGRIKVLTDKANIVIPLYYFPGFKVWVDGENTAIEKIGDLGLIGISVEKGDHIVKVKLLNTPVRTIGDIVSLGSLLLVLLVSLGIKPNILLNKYKNIIHV